ncbi:MAG TPA: hypothetical protein VLQ93_14850, partial [Myxococcaceae bacterium]|nr:hypothetical protein [Myxococcaceae bacterium]
PSLQALALEVSAFHGEAPEEAALASLASHEDVRVRVAALRCAWLLPERARAGFVPAALAAKSPAVRRAGLELGLLCGSRAAWRACGELARTSSSERALAWVVLALSGGDAELQPVLQGLDADRTRPLALWALGFSGRLAAADACLEMMDAEPSLAPLAAEAFSAITGLRIEERYAVTPPEDEETTLPPLEEDDLDANLVPAPEESLPLPAVEAIADWWRQARKQLEPRVRYLHGQPFSGRVLLQALEQASMRRRHVLALELSLRSGGALRLQARGRVARQYRELREASGALHRISGGTFDKLMTAG